MKYDSKKTFALVLCVLCIAVGLLLLIFPKKTIYTACSVTGTLSLVIGIIKLILSKKGKVFGAGAVILGIILLLHPKIIVSILPFIIGVFILAMATDGLRDALKLYKNVGRSALVSFIVPSITLILGALIAFNPFDSVAFIISLIGVALTATGISRLVMLLKNNKEPLPENAEDKAIEVEFTDVDSSQDD